jgi:hypothetical protein
MKLAASRGASGVAVLYNRRMCGLRDNEETRRELRMHGHVPDAVFRAEGMNYVGKATAVMEPTGKRWGRGPTRILNRSEEWMSDPGAVENAATHVESRRHKRHCSNNAERSREGKITSFNTAIYDDFCADSCIAQHLKLTDLAVCPLSRVRGFIWAADYLVYLAEEREVTHRDLVKNGLNKKPGGAGKRGPGNEPEHLKGSEVQKKRSSRCREGCAAAKGLTRLSLSELKALRPRRQLQCEIEENARKKGITLAQADPFRLKYYDDYGRCKRYYDRAGAWRNVCVGAGCNATYEWQGRTNGKRKNGPRVTGFNCCRKCPEPR